MLIPGNEVIQLEHHNNMQELMDFPIWFLWRWGKDKNGNAIKVPFSSNGGKTGTNLPYKNTWVTYDEAVKAKDIQKADGIGFRVPEGYFFLDVDGKEVEHPFVQIMLKRYNTS